MADPDSVEAEQVVAAVEAGTDGIEVAGELLEESANPTPQARSLFAAIASMMMSEKIKLALRGNRDARQILIRDSNKVIRRLVLQNPRIGDAEVIAVTNNRTADDELLRMIADRREWVRNYQVRLGLAKNPKTPLVIAMKQLAFLGERDIRALAKSRNVPGGVATQARRILATKNPNG